MLTPAHLALPRPALLSRPRAALVCVSLFSTLLLTSIGFAQTQPPPPPPAGVTTATPPATTVLPPPPQPPPATTATPPAGYVPQPGATPPPPPGYGSPPGYAPQSGYGPQPGYGPPPGNYGQTPPGYGPMPPGYPPYYGYGPYDGLSAGPLPPKYQRHNTRMMVGGVLLTTGGVLGLLIGTSVAISAGDQIPVYCEQPGFGVTECERRADKTQLAGGVVMLLTGIAAIGVGIPLWIIGGKREPVKDNPAAPSAQPSTPEAPKTGLQLIVGPSSAALRATF